MRHDWQQITSGPVTVDAECCACGILASQMDRHDVQEGCQA